MNSDRVGSDRISIVLPLPPRELTPNGRAHWAAKARLTRAYREYANAVTRSAGGANRRWKRATARATFYFATKRRRDKDNANASIKAAFDGIVDAKLIVDDRDDVLTHAPPEFAVDARNPRVEIVITRSEQQR